MTDLRAVAPVAVHTSTADVPVDPGAGARAIWGRRVLLSLLVLVVLAGITGLLGVRARTVTARNASDGVTLDVHYAQVARAGLDVPFEITVHRRGGFTGEVTVAISRAYLDMFDQNAIDPEPASETGNAQELVWHFDPPAGDTLVVSLDMQVQGGRHWGKSGYVAVRERGRSLARATFTTHLAP